MHNCQLVFELPSQHCTTLVPSGWYLQLQKYPLILVMLSIVLDFASALLFLL